MKRDFKQSSSSSFSRSLPVLLALLLFWASLPAAADVIQAGRDVQSAIDSAQPGDMVLVRAGEVNSFVVDRPLTIEGQDSPTVSAAMQKPAIKVLSDGVTVSGFAIRGWQRIPLPSSIIICKILPLPPMPAWMIPTRL